MPLTPMVCGSTYTTANLLDNVNALMAQTDNRDVRVVAGVIRNSGAGWQLIGDATHKAMNVDSVTSSGSFITIGYPSINGKKVVSFVITPDETFQAEGYQIGASVTPTGANIQLSRILGVSGYFQFNAASGGSFSAPIGTPIGITDITWDAANQFAVVSHQGMGASQVHMQPVVTPRRSTPFTKLEVVSEFSSTFYFVDNAGNKITPPGGSGFWFSRGLGQIDRNMNAASVVSGIGNFWFIGLIEV
jgi:hypothetical protein